MSKKPTIKVYSDIPPGFDPADENENLPLSSDDDADETPETLIGFTADDENDISFTPEDEEDAEEQAFLFDCAVEWLPNTDQIAALIDDGIRLDYGVLVSARLTVEEFQHDVTDEELDNMVAALLLYAEEDEELRAAFSEHLSIGAQHLAAELQSVTYAKSRAEFSAASVEARQLMWMGVLSDLTVAQEMFEEMDELVEYDDMKLSADLFEMMSAQNDMPARLVDRAESLFNDMASAQDIPLRLKREGDRLIVDRRDGMEIKFRPKPPKP